MVARAKNRKKKKTLKDISTKARSRFQNNFTDMFLLCLFTKLLKWFYRAEETCHQSKKLTRSKLCRFFPCWCFRSSFPAGASDLYSLLVLQVFFLCWCFRSSFPAGASGLLSLLVLQVFFPCWCFRSSFPAGVSQISYFCHNKQTKWSPLIDIVQAMKQSLTQIF